MSIPNLREVGPPLIRSSTLLSALTPRGCDFARFGLPFAGAASYPAESQTRSRAMTRPGTARIDTTDGKGARADQRLRTSRVAWLTTVASDGTPQTSPIWFLWDGGDITIYSLDSPRVRNLELHGRVSLNLDGNGLGGDIVVIEGTARIDRSLPSAADNADYLDKYRPVLDEYGWTPEWFAARYSVPVIVTPTRYRYW
jgi:PPOX class probable F420-dependent enzyme